MLSDAVSQGHKSRSRQEKHKKGIESAVKHEKHEKLLAVTNNQSNYNSKWPCSK